MDARPKPVEQAVAERIVAKLDARNSLAVAILSATDGAGRAGRTLAEIVRRVMDRGLSPTPEQMREALDYMISKGCVFRLASGRYRSAASLREIHATCLAYEMAEDETRSGRQWDWRRLKRNARARLDRASRKTDQGKHTRH